MFNVSRKEDVVPVMIGYRTDGMKPLLKRWRKRNPGVPWSYLITQSLQRQIGDLAGKKDQKIFASR